MFQSHARRQGRAITILDDSSEPPPAALWLTPEEISAEIGVCVGTLANWRSQKRGPEFHRLGRKIRYRADEFNAWRERTRVRTRG